MISGRNIHIGLLAGALVFLVWPTPTIAIQTESDPAIVQAAAEKPAFFYTLQIEQGSDLATLEKKADYLAQLLPLRVRIVKEEEIYAIRLGKSFQTNELESHLSTLKSVGFWTAVVLYLPVNEEEVIRVINPELPESINQPKDQPYLLQARQEQSPIVTRLMNEVFPTEIELSRLYRLKKAMDQEPPGEEADAIVQRAWEAYRHGSLANACELFESAQNLPGVDQDALRGLAHCFLQMGNYEEAIALLTWFIQKNVKTEENRTLLVEALFKAGKYDSALTEAHHLEEAQARQWNALISTAQTKVEIARIRKRYDPQKPEAFVEKYRMYLDQCLLSDMFIQAAKDLMTAKNTAADPLIEQLLNACDGRWDVKLSAYTGLMQILPPETMRQRIERELERLSLPSDYREKLLASAAKLEPNNPKKR